MRNDKHLAFELRRKGVSYKQIRKQLDIPLSTLSGWFADEAWSIKIKDKLIIRTAKNVSRTQKLRWKKWREDAREEARQQFPHYCRDPLFIAGLMIYWGEGDKSDNSGMFGISNTDPNMMRLFTIFTIKFGLVPKEKIRCQVVLYPDLHEITCIKYWSKEMGVSPKQFYRAQYIQGRHPTKQLLYGICGIRFSHRQLKDKVLTWIDMFQKGYPLPHEYQSIAKAENLLYQ